MNRVSGRKLSIVSKQRGFIGLHWAAGLTLSLALLHGCASAGERCPDRADYAGPPARAALESSAFPTPEPALAPAHLATPQALAMDALFDRFLRATSTPALDVAVLHEDGRAWTRRHVAQVPAAQNEDSTPLFYWASVGKAWVAVLALQLAEQGRLDLEAPIKTWAPEFPGAGQIRIVDLLRHTSGLYSFQEDPELRARPGYKSPAELLAVARAHPLQFCPGTQWAYSNSGYVLLGQIIETLEARPLAESLRARIIQPLGLQHTRALGPASALDGIVPPAPSAAAGGTADDLRTPGAAGPIAASAEDMARFWMATFQGELLSTSGSRERFGHLLPGLGQHFGLGVMVYDVPPSTSTSADTWLGHSGGLPGAKAVVAWSVRHRAVAAVALTGDASAEALANRLLAVFEAVPEDGSRNRGAVRRRRTSARPAKLEHPGVGCPKPQAPRTLAAGASGQDRAPV